MHLVFMHYCPRTGVFVGPISGFFYLMDITSVLFLRFVSFVKSKLVFFCLFHALGIFKKVVLLTSYLQTSLKQSSRVFFYVFCHGSVSVGTCRQYKKKEHLIFLCPFSVGSWGPSHVGATHTSRRASISSIFLFASFPHCP